MRRLNVVNKKKALQVIKEIDAFPKVPESYKETTVSGGGISIIVFIAIGILVVSELRYYAASELKYSYDVDSDFEGKLKINIDMTVAMPCSTIGADVLDMTGQNVNSFGKLEETDVYFDLSPKQRNFFDMIQNVNDYVKNEYHALHDVLWTTGYGMLAQSMPEREDNPTGKKNGCRLQGTLTVNKVAGNFHITAGKSVPVFPSGHMHLALSNSNQYNFSHRITSFSFGEHMTGIVNPLDGEEKITYDNYHMYQYFMQVVPTEVRTRLDNIDTYMYAVTEKNRSINHSQGSHGVPGIFVKYDMSSLKVAVKEERRPYWRFLVRLCGIVGGIFATSGLLHNLTGFAVDCMCCRYKWGKYSERSSSNDTAKSSTINQNLPTQTLLNQTDLPAAGYSEPAIPAASNFTEISSQDVSGVTLLSQNHSTTSPPSSDVQS